jgi:hypothetical protein
MRFIWLLVLIILTFCQINLFSQHVDNNSEKFKVKIGNLAFALDSIDFSLGTVLTGNVFQKEIEVKNTGNKSVSFQKNKTQPFLDVQVPAQLTPGSTASVIMLFDPDQTYTKGRFDAELNLITDDLISPYKYLYFTAFITEDTTSRFGVGLIDSVPRLVFEQLNYSFGDLSRARIFDYQFNFSNLGAEVLVIDSLAFSKGCKILSYPQKSYYPGESGSIIVRINTMYSYGVQHRWIKVFSNDPRNPVIILGTHGSVYMKSEKNKDPDFCYE